jgi:uncharacterized protein
MIELSHWPRLLLAGLAVFAGALVQASAGIGLGAVAAPILLMTYPLFVPGPLLAVGTLLSALISAREWRSIDRKGLSMALLGRIAGSILAGATLSLIPLASYDLLFGMLVLCAVLLSNTGWRVRPTTRNLLTAGAASGFMGTLTAIGAPPMALVYQHGTPSTIRSTLAAYFLLGASFSIVVLATVGKFGAEQIVASLLLIPPLAAGFWASNHILPHMNSTRVRRAVLWVAGASAVVLILKALK